ncbi:hypothetical protein HN937_05465 [Candidatus Poribacteria bacterium]|jgi:hypothetical protein|nr:hypothetical protein [Candidatus Poribacteria bacterium]
MPIWKVWVTRDYRFEDWVDVEADTKAEAEELGLEDEELEVAGSSCTLDEYAEAELTE